MEGREEKMLYYFFESDAYRDLYNTLLGEDPNLAEQFADMFTPDGNYYKVETSVYDAFLSDMFGDDPLDWGDFGGWDFSGTGLSTQSGGTT